MTDGLLAIGAFSRASSLSVRTLRAYHQSGLLVPASVDPSTGYRSYSADQLADAMTIVRLRALDVPLPLVHEILTARDPGTTRAVLARHERTMRERLAEAERIVAALQDGTPRTTTPAHVFDTPSVTTLQCSARVPSASLWGWLAARATRLVSLAGARLAEPVTVGALYTAALLDDTHEEVTAFVVIDAPFLLDQGPHRDEGIGIGEIPARRWAALSHVGGFAGVGDTYRLLGAWVAHHAAPEPDAPICEVYPRLPAGGEDADQEIEIRWPLPAHPEPTRSGDRRPTVC
jgi:DNA-binding transcriptional MerR regulator